MNTIKFLKNNFVLVNKVLYKGYVVGELPPTFGFIYNADTETDGISEFFNFKGLTYIKAK